MGIRFIASGQTTTTLRQSPGESVRLSSPDQYSSRVLRGRISEPPEGTVMQKGRAVQSHTRADQNVSFSSKLGITGFTATRQPQVTVQQSARPFLTNVVDEARVLVVNEILREAQNSYLPVVRVDVSGFQDPEENFGEVVIRAWVDGDAEALERFWNSLGLAIEDLGRSLPDNLQEAMLSRIAIEVQPVHAPTAV